MSKQLKPVIRVNQTFLFLPMTTANTFIALKYHGAALNSTKLISPNQSTVQRTFSRNAIKKFLKVNCSCVLKLYAPKSCSLYETVKNASQNGIFACLQGHLHCKNSLVRT